MMKHLKSLAIALLFTTAFIACKKDKEDPEPTPETDRTVLLTQNSWQIRHLNQSQGGDKWYYDRGGSNNTHDYGNDLLQFNTDGSGTYTTSAGNSYTISWQFDNSDKTELTYTINGFNGNLAIKLENIFLDENNFRYSEMYGTGTNYSGGSIYRIPKL